MSDLETKNAVIEKAILDIGDRGFLTASIHLNYGDGTRQAFGNYALYLPKSFKNHSVKSDAGHFIFRVMEIAGASTWDMLKGQTIRVKANYLGVSEIGHIINDDWFNPQEEFKE